MSKIGNVKFRVFDETIDMWIAEIEDHYTSRFECVEDETAGYGHGKDDAVMDLFNADKIVSTKSNVFYRPVVVDVYGDYGTEVINIGWMKFAVVEKFVIEDWEDEGEHKTNVPL